MTKPDPLLAKAGTLSDASVVEPAWKTAGDSALPAAPRVPRYRVRLAESEEDVIRAQKLRFAVFNVELGEGLIESHTTGMDVDAYDSCCDHLIVETGNTGEIVGTYRMQTGALAAANLGYYSEQEFDFAPFESVRCEMVELGRACIHRDHRHAGLLHLLWRAIIKYTRHRGARYLIGCSSLNSQDPAVGLAVFEALKHQHLVEPTFQTSPWPNYALAETLPATESANPPRLLRAYLGIGAKICGKPAIDRDFGTIDFLTLLDLEQISEPARSRFLE